MIVEPRKPKILLLDIETSPNLGYVWGKWQQDVIDFEKQWHLLSFAWKWYGESKKTFVLGLPDFESYRKNKESDAQLAYHLWGLFDEADVIVAHNGDAFDIPKCNSRFIAAGLKPPAPYKTIDTWKIAKARFGFTSNKLNDLGKELRVGEKVQTGGFSTWAGCMRGDKDSWKLMKKYNAQDVDLLEKVYEKLAPWAKTLPNLNAITEGDACPHCQGKVQKRGYEATLTGKKQRYHCQKCGRWSYGATQKVDITVR
jgi:DNA polymerase elongation subunit (family B)